MIWFGPSGNSESFYREGNRHSWQMPRWLKKMGLNAYEYQCNKGTNIKKETAEKIGEEAKKAGIRMSIHAPYYINLASVEEKKRDNSIQYILNSAFTSLYGSKNFPMNFSVVNTILIPASFTATAAGSLVTATGSYVAPFILLIALSVVSLFLNISIRQP